MNRAVLTLTSAIEEWLEAERACVNRGGGVGGGVVEGVTNYLPLQASANAA